MHWQENNFGYTWCLTVTEYPKTLALLKSQFIISCKYNDDPKYVKMNSLFFKHSVWIIQLDSSDFLFCLENHPSTQWKYVCYNNWI